MITLKVRKDRIAPIRRGHPWVFSGSLIDIPENITAGTPVRLINTDLGFLATGYFNTDSQIAVRIWGYDETEDINRDFFIKRIARAYSTRDILIKGEDTDSYRVVNGENDLLPGLIVDKYSGYLVVQFHTQGIEAWRDMIVDALIEVLEPEGIYERSDVPVRRLKDNKEKKGLLYGRVPDLIQIRENGLLFLVDVKHGQKTGFFLDQREKRRAILKYSNNRCVLNCFSYTGGFTVYALHGGARHVTCVDVSQDALELAKENIKLNGLDQKRCAFLCHDVKGYLRDCKHGSFDLVILDPPAFIKDRNKKRSGIAGYKNINASAIKILPEDGILVTCSCSAHLSLSEFRNIISLACDRTDRKGVILETFTHGLDHPLLISFNEGEYLKCLFVKVYRV